MENTSIISELRKAQMKEFTKENGLITLKTVLADKHITVLVNTTDTGRMAKDTGKVLCHTLTKTFTQATGHKAKKMEKEHTLLHQQTKNMLGHS